MADIEPSGDRAIERMKGPQELRARTKRFALRILRLFEALPRTEAGRIIGRQVLRSAMSVGANYRAVNRARSRAEFISKMGIVVEEMDETVYWLEILVDGKIVPGDRMVALLQEGNELLAIFAASRNTARSNARKKPTPPPA
jgi:four helix bundle protein